MSNHLIIFDTTLRDGEQSPGASMTRDEKLRIAKQLEEPFAEPVRGGTFEQFSSMPRQAESRFGIPERHLADDARDLRRLRGVRLQRKRSLIVSWRD